MENRIQRLSRAEGIELIQKAPLGHLMRRAHAIRMQRHPKARVTYVCDTNPNYTNICATRCHFCAFWRAEGSGDAYTLDPIQLAERVSKAAHIGATTVLLQGGHNPDLKLSDWLAYIQTIQSTTPDMHIHPFGPPEIVFMAENEGITTEAVLQQLWNAGIRTMPGGGAEVLSDRVRHAIAPEKCTAESWLEVMAQAHKIGFKTTATLMYGHIEKPEEIVDHLLKLRDLQDQTGGFQSFVPWSFKPGKTPLGRRLKQTASPQMYLRIISVARLMLDNFSHIQSSWFSEERQAGQLGLLAGADDFGGLLIEENVLDSAGYSPAISIQELEQDIRAMGFEPVRRDSFYKQIKNTFEKYSGAYQRA